MGLVMVDSMMLSNAPKIVKHQSSIQFSFHFLKVHIFNDKAWVQLAAPPLNILNNEMQIEITSVFHQLKMRKDISVISLSAQGNNFCSGINIKEIFQGLEFGKGLKFCLDFARMLDAIAAVNKPILGFIKGYAFGAGATLAALCDYSIAAPNAKFSYPERKIGLKPSVSLPYLIPRMGNLAIFPFLSGKIWNAQEAQKFKLIDEICGDKNKLIVKKKSLLKQFSNSPMRLNRSFIPQKNNITLDMDFSLKNYFETIKRIYPNRTEEGREMLIQYTAQDLFNDLSKPLALELFSRYFKH